jgi:hypothetical protein
MGHIESPGLTDIFSRQALMSEAVGEFVFLPKFIRSLDYDQLLGMLKQIDSMKTARGSYTLAIIKPTVRLESDLTQLNPAVTMTDHAPTDETGVAERLLQKIPPCLTPKLCFSLTMDERDVAIFYGERIKTGQQVAQPVDPRRYGETHPTRWDEFLYWITHEPATFVILEDRNPTPDDNAVTKWLVAVGRGKQRSWDVREIKQILPHSLRGLFARDNHNNIFHASASSEEFLREVASLKQMILRRKKSHQALVS